MYNDDCTRNNFLKNYNICLFSEPISLDSLNCEVVNSKQDWKFIDEEFNNKKIVVIDNFLNEEFIQRLRFFKLTTNCRHDYYLDYAAINYKRLPGEIWFPVLSNIVDESKKLIRVLSDREFIRAWSFIYESKSKGVKLHSDAGLTNININLWITPEESMVDLEENNGLAIWPVACPEDWLEEEYNGNEEKAFQYLQEKKITPLKIKYKFNRAILFNSKFFHKSYPVNTKPGYQNSRINFTFLFK